MGNGKSTNPGQDQQAPCSATNSRRIAQCEGAPGTVHPPARLPRDTTLANLRRQRVRVHRVLDRLEPQVEAYRAKLVRIEASIRELAPELPLAGRFRKPNPHFARGELTRLALAVLREAGEPMRIRDIAAECLRRKGLYPPSRTLLRQTVQRLQQTFSVLAKRGITVKAGEGRETKRTLTRI